MHFPTDLDQPNLSLDLAKITHQIQIGHDIELHCGTTDNKSGTPTQSPTYWYFISCRHQSSCNKAMESHNSEDNWQKIQCFTDGHCGTALRIANPTESDSGLYRCSTHSEQSFETQVATLYFLDVRSNPILLLC